MSLSNSPSLIVTLFASNLASALCHGHLISDLQISWSSTLFFGQTRWYKATAQPICGHICTNVKASFVDCSFKKITDETWYISTNHILSYCRVVTIVTLHSLLGVCGAVVDNIAQLTLEHCACRFSLGSGPSIEYRLTQRTAGQSLAQD